MVANITPIETAHSLPMPGLTADDLAILRKPFAANEHEFHRGFAYVAEQAITTRLEDVDPGYEFVILSTSYREKQVIVTARMTVKGVSRDGVGMQSVLETADKKTGELREVGEPEKGAATDALKRCARLFGVGRYLLNLPENVKDMAALAAWLAPKRQERRIDTSKGTPENDKPAPDPVDPYANLRSQLEEAGVTTITSIKNITDTRVRIVTKEDYSAMLPGMLASVKLTVAKVGERYFEIEKG